MKQNTGFYWEHKHTLKIDHLSSYFYKTIQNKCLNHLKYQSVVRIHAHEIALAMHISHRTVEVHVQKALLFLKEDLNK